MAKKKETAKPASKKKDNTLLYGLGVLILIVIIVIIIRSGKEPVSTDVDVTPSDVKETPTTQTEPKLEGVTEELKCDESATIGFKACNALADRNVEVVILHQGKATLTGAQYYFYDENGDKVAEASQLGVIEGGAEAKYTLPLSTYPDAEKVEIRPITNIDGADKICVNQRVIIIPANSCR